MKSLKYIIIAAVLALSFTSCLEYNLKPLDVYDGADITGAYVYYRYMDNSKTFPLSGAHAVKQSTLTVKNTIDPASRTCNITASIPSNFPEAEKGNISASKLVVAVNISTAAVITPTGGSPALGTPADWSSPHKYIVEAADGTQKEWTITVTLNK
ncbi:MAG: hypothetical protein IKW89_01160 [Bacteroidales bacterium]|nr:hypothetical protein [Bacteroidales bacterium]